MWQTLGQANSHHSVSTATESYAPYSHQQHSTNQDRELRPQLYSQQLQDDLSGDIFESWGPLGSEDEEVIGGADLSLGSHMGEEAPLCSQTDMEELRRSCSESQCTAGNVNGHVSVPLMWFTLKLVYIETGLVCPVYILICIHQSRLAVMISHVQVSQVEVYPGSGVLCDVRSWQAACQTQSPTAMARTLLMGVFDMNTLMNSNLRGGRSRRPAFQPQRSALDPHKINAIFSRFRRFARMFLSSDWICLTFWSSCLSFFISFALPLCHSSFLSVS